MWRTSCFSGHCKDYFTRAPQHWCAYLSPQHPAGSAQIPPAPPGLWALGWKQFPSPKLQGCLSRRKALPCASFPSLPQSSDSSPTLSWLPPRTPQPSTWHRTPAPPDSQQGVRARAGSTDKLSVLSSAAQRLADISIWGTFHLKVGISGFFGGSRRFGNSGSKCLHGISWGSLFTVLIFFLSFVFWP